MGTEKHALCVALATLIYVDWLPTGQWSAVSPTVYKRKSQISLCRHSLSVDSSNLEMAEALSGCLQLLLFIGQMYPYIRQYYLSSCPT